MSVNLKTLYAELVGTAQAIVKSGAISMSVLLLANHGVLSFGQNGMQAVQMNVIVEEAAQAAIYASIIGGPKVVPPELLHTSHTRAAHFEAKGTLHA